MKLHFTFHFHITSQAEFRGALQVKGMVMNFHLLRGWLVLIVASVASKPQQKVITPPCMRALKIPSHLSFGYLRTWVLYTGKSHV